MNPPTMVYHGRFALLWHEIPEVQDATRSANSDSSASSHWDLLLELDNDQLLTWQIARLPDLENLAQNCEIDAKRLQNHRPVYLDYEGPISDNRGSVQRLASGVYAAAFVTSSSPDGARHLFRSEVSSEKVLGPLPFASIDSDQELLVAELASSARCSPEWKLALKTKVAAVGHTTLMTLSQPS